MPSGAPVRRGDSLECRERSNQQDLQHRGLGLPMLFECRYSKGNTLNGNQNLDNYRYFVFIWFFIDRGFIQQY